MFTGIIECTGRVREINKSGSNLSFWIESPVSAALQPDQSLCHDGVCLTVEDVRDNRHRVTAIAETLKKTTLSRWKAETLVNLERCLQLNGRLDGHIVQGHVDTTARCIKRKEKNGNLELEFEFPQKYAALVIEKGSITVNGISLTAFRVKKKSFSVAIIPYTREHTNIGHTEKNDRLNIEFDMIGKYLQRNLLVNRK